MYPNLFQAFRNAFLFGLFLVSTISAQGQFRKIFSNSYSNSDVQTIQFISDKEGYCAFREWIGYTPDSGRTFKEIRISSPNVNFNGYPVNITFGFGINGIHAFNRNEILVYGQYGGVPSILYSSDGGNTFKLQYHSPSGYSGEGTTRIVFTSRSTGYATEQDRIMKSTDGGLSWQQVLDSYKNNFSDIQALDANLLYACSNSTGTRKMLWRSENAGQSWTQVNLPSSSDGILSHIYFISRNKGWMSFSWPEPGTTWYTSNGGETWKMMMDPKINHFYARKLQFVNDSTGYAAGESNKLFKTTDSGRIWEPLPNYPVPVTETRISELRTFFIFNDKLMWTGSKDFGTIAISENAGGQALPKAICQVDTTNYSFTGITRLLNFSKKDCEYRWLVNKVLVSMDYNTSYKHHYSLTTDTIQLVTIRNGNTDTMTRYQFYPMLYVPGIQSVKPTIAEEGTMVEISGGGFDNVKEVFFGGVPATSFRLVSPGKIQASVGKGASGDVTLSTGFVSISFPGFQFRTVTDLPPEITGISQDYGNIGTSITLTGKHFNASASGNQVSFGSIKANITSASSGSLTFTVPAGAIFGPVTVLNKETGLSASAPKPFRVTFPDSLNFTYESFSEALVRNLGGPDVYGSALSDYSAEDIDGDGKADILMLHSRNVNSVRIYPNTSSGGKISLGEPVDISLGRIFTDRLLLRDIDNDGRPDILVHREEDDDPLFLRNISTPGNFAFDSPQTFEGFGEYTSLACDDLDGDGRNDIVLARKGRSELAFFRNTSVPGQISFSAPQLVILEDEVEWIGADDLDGDGKKELVVYTGKSTTGTFKLNIFRNTGSRGNIRFANKFVINVPGYTHGSKTFQMADLDMDGRTDIVLVNNTHMVVYLNNSTTGNIDFIASLTKETTELYRPMIANFTGRKHPDLWVRGNGVTTHSFLNESAPGTARFHELIYYYYFNIGDLYGAVADFNGDGKPDIVTNTFNLNQLKILENKIGEDHIVRICSNKEDFIEFIRPGNNYQWQADKGTGFTDINDDEIFSGSQTNKIKMKNLSSSWDNAVFHCKVDGRPGTRFRLMVAGKLPLHASLDKNAAQFCNGEAPSVKGSTSNMGTSPVFYWYLNSQQVHHLGKDSFFISDRVKHGDKLYAIVQSDEKCSIGDQTTTDTITFSQLGTLARVSIDPVALVCSDSLTVFKTTVANGGSMPSFAWTSNGIPVGNDSPELSISLKGQTGKLAVTMTSNSEVCNSGVVTATADFPITSSTSAAVDLSVKPINVCDNVPVTFTAQASNISLPQYEWFVNDVSAGNNNRIYKVSLPAGSRVKVKVFTSKRCVLPAISAPVTLLQGQGPFKSPEITLNGKNLAQTGETVLLNAVITDPGTQTSILWEDSTYWNGWTPVPFTEGMTSIQYNAMPPAKVRIVYRADINCVGDTTIISTPHSINLGTVTGIGPDPAAALGIRHYPNPVSHQLVIEGLNLSDQWQTMVISDLSGQKKMEASLKNVKKVTLQVPLLPNGLYLVTLQRKNGKKAYLKFVKQ